MYSESSTNHDLSSISNRNGIPSSRLTLWGGGEAGGEKAGGERRGGEGRRNESGQFLLVGSPGSKLFQR